MRPPALDDPTADRLVKLLRLTTSSHDGECVAAARRANELLKRLGLDWGDLIRAPSIAPSGNEPPTWREQLDVCVAAAALGELGDRDRDFIVTLARFGTTPSPKQKKWLRDVYRRVTS